MEYRAHDPEHTDLDVSLGKHDSKEIDANKDSGYHHTSCQYCRSRSQYLHVIILRIPAQLVTRDPLYTLIALQMVGADPD